MLTAGKPALTDSVILAAAAPPDMPAGAWPMRARLLADAAIRLGPRACALMAWHRLRLRAGVVQRALPDLAIPDGPLLPPQAPEGGIDGNAATFAAAAEAAIAPGWHGPFRADAPAIGLDLFAPGDIRPVWETNRLLALPLLAQAARLAPADGHLARAEAVLRGWIAANPPFRGPAWACGQEAALRGMHLCLALAVLDADRALPPAMRGVLAAHARRIGATRAYAAAQDNNHAVSEAAGLFVLGLVLGDAAMARDAARGLSRTVARLVAPDGAFAQASPGYHRLLIDTLWLAEWFRQRHGAPAFAAPFATRAAAATAWLERVMDLVTGALPRCGAVDDSALADLSLHGPADARGSVARARALFGAAPFSNRDAEPSGAPPHHPDDPPMATSSWRSEGWAGWHVGRVRLLLRTGAPMRFRPGQADLLHLDLALDGVPLLIDGGTGAYNPPPGSAWWTDALAGTPGHNTICFDGEDQMPRAGRFLFARWPRCDAVPGGARLRDARGRRHERRIAIQAGAVSVEDRVGGPFAVLALRWRLAAGDWRIAEGGAECARARLRLEADAPSRIRLAPGWHSPAYGRVEPAQVLELVAAAPVSRLVTLVEPR